MRWISLIGALALWMGNAWAAEISEADMRRFLVAAPPTALPPGLPPAGVPDLKAANAAALDSATNYAVIAPIYTGADSNLSFIRLANEIPPGTTGTTVSFPVSVVGLPSGTVYGTKTYTLGRFIAKQIAIGDLLNDAGVTGLSGGDTGYALYIAQTDANAKYMAYQHVIYSNQSSFFENATLCSTYRPGAGTVQQGITNVHTSALSNYPSQIFLHNYQNTTVPYIMYIFDVNAGVPLGALTVTAAPNASYLIPESFIEQQINFGPSPSQQHISIFVWNRPANGVYNAVNAVVGHYIYNQALAAYVNMTVSCMVAGG